MNAFTWTAAALALLLAGAHSTLGERYILVRLFRRDNLPKLFGGTAFTRHTLRFAWHLTSVAWCGLAVILVLAGRRGAYEPRDVARAAAATFALSGAVALFGSRGRHLAWIVFFAIAALAWAGGS